MKKITKGGENMRIDKIISSILTVGVIAFAVYWIGSKINIYLDYKGRSDCARDYHLEYTDTAASTKVIKPLEDLYNQCLQEKGLKIK